MADKYQKEIEDILRQAEADAPMPRAKQQSLPSLVRQYVRQTLTASRWSMSAGRLMLAAGAILLAALVLRFMLPAASAPLMWIALIVFIVAYAMFFVRPPKRTERRMWRGQYIDDEQSGGSWLNRLKRRFRK